MSSTPLDSGLANVCKHCGEYPFIRVWFGGGQRARAIYCGNIDCSVRPEAKGVSGVKALIKWNDENAQPND